jgi:hypothetical protein
VTGRQDPSPQFNPPLEGASGGGRRPILLAALALALLVIGVVAYFEGDLLTELASSLTSTRAIHGQGHIRY